MTPSEFVVMEHKAKRAGLHFDLRFKMPKSNMWASFAVPKGVPTEPAKKVLAIRTTDHTKKEALLVGYIEDGYGAGQLTKWDGGRCVIMKYSDSHIAIDFNGSKVKGNYHMISTTKAGDKDQKSYFLFKSKSADKIYESCGMVSKENFPDMSGGGGMGCRVPPADTTETEERDEDDVVHPSLTWSKTTQTVGSGKTPRTVGK